MHPCAGSQPGTAAQRRYRTSDPTDSDFPAAYPVERGIGFTFPGVDREAFAELGDEDFVLGALVLFECLLAVLCA